MIPKRIEDIAFANLKKSFSNLLKNGLKKTVREAIAWAGEFENYELINFSSPSFIPDATRFRKCMRVPHGGSRDYEKVPVVEMWEIEDTSRINIEKLNKIESWWFYNFDPHFIPLFELWTTDRWGNNRNLIWADWRDEYGMGAPVEYSKKTEVFACQ